MKTSSAPSCRPQGLSTLNKHLRGCLAAETCIYTKDSARFIHGKVAAGNATTSSNGTSH